MSKNLIKQLRTLIAIDGFIRDCNFVATQESIATELGLSVRSIRYYWVLLESLDAPLVHNHGRWSNGWSYSDEPWDLFDSLKKAAKDHL
jgi:hypothetical protein